jgi:low affinity Fe/Cu permease
MAGPGQPADRRRSSGSRLLSGLDRLASRPLLALVLLAADLAWVVFSVVLGFPSRLEAIFQTLVAAVTLAMVFVIHHSQARQQAATQRKLDEILHAIPGANDALLSLEHASDDELRATGDSHQAIRQDAVNEGPGEADSRP